MGTFIRDKLWLGAVEDAYDSKRLNEQGTTHILTIECSAMREVGADDKRGCNELCSARWVPLTSFTLNLTLGQTRGVYLPLHQRRGFGRGGSPSFLRRLLPIHRNGPSD